MLKAAVFDIYERGNVDVAQWMQVVSHEHLLRFVVEQFPPLDFMNTFGGPMVEEFNKVFRAPSDAMYGHGILASGLIAKDEPWSRVLNHLPQLSALNPGIQNLVTAKNTLFVPDPEGPLEDGLDHWQEATRRSL